MARPKKVIDKDMVYSLAGINCTTEEIATVLGCSKDTLERRFAALIKRGREHGRSSLRRMMWDKCKNGNVTMMIWLSKQLLGYTDNYGITLDTDEPDKKLIIYESQWGNTTEPAINHPTEKDSETILATSRPVEIS